jgi:hypothetical protein
MFVGLVGGWPLIYAALIFPSGLRFGTEESVARNAKRMPWLKLPHFTRKLAVRTHQNT